MVLKIDLVFFYRYYCCFIFLWGGNTRQMPNMFLTRFWRFTAKQIFQKHSSHKTSWVRTFWAQYEVMYVRAGGHAGPQTALLNHSSRGHHLYTHHLGTHEITGTPWMTSNNTSTLQDWCGWNIWSVWAWMWTVSQTCVCLCVEKQGDIPGPQCCHRCFSSCLMPVWPPSRPENWTPWNPARGPYSNHAHSTRIT